MDICLNSSFVYLSDDSLSIVNGGTFWGVVAGAFGVVAGVATVVGGVALLAVPEPTTITKSGGAAAIVTGVAGIVSGVAAISSNW